MKDRIWWLVLGLIVLHIGIYITAFRFFFLRPFDAGRMGKIYSYSPYVVDSGSKIGIGDDGLYAFAGYYYLFDGGDVSSVNFEHPRG